MKDEEGIERKEAQINGRTEGPFSADDTDIDRPAEDNRNREDQENSANGLDSLQVRGGQDGRNNRGVGSTDMDSKNGVLRMGDQDNSTMEVTDQGMQSAISDTGKSTNTAMVDVTTSGPDDYGSDDKVPVPDAQKAAKSQNDAPAEEGTNADDPNRDAEIAETGTDLNNQPTY